MKNAWDYVKLLHVRDAVHKKKRFTLQSIKEIDVLKHTMQEVLELAVSPTDIKEMADIFACLMHYCVIRGWDMAEVEDVIIDKLNERFVMQ